MEDIEETAPDTQRLVSPEDEARTALNGTLAALGRADMRALQRIAEGMRLAASVEAPHAPPSSAHDPVVVVVACTCQAAKITRVSP